MISICKSQHIWRLLYSSSIDKSKINKINNNNTHTHTKCEWYIVSLTTIHLELEAFNV